MDLSRRDVMCGLGFAAGAALGGIFRGASGPRNTELLRPPGVADEASFLAACIRCGLCAEVCPRHALKVAGAGCGLAIGTPFFDARVNPCDSCFRQDRMKCIAACPTTALAPVERAHVRIGTAVINEDTCLAYNNVMCRACWHACPFADSALELHAIEFDEEEEDSSSGRGQGRGRGRRRRGRMRPVVNAAACTGCGLCTGACPTEPGSMPIVAAGSAKKHASGDRT